MKLSNEKAQVTPWSRVIIWKLTVAQMVKNPPHFKEFVGSPTCSNVPATCPVLSQTNPVHVLPAYFCTRHFRARLIQSTSFRPVSVRYSLTFCSHLSTFLLRAPVLQVFLPKHCVNIFAPPFVPHAPPISP